MVKSGDLAEFMNFRFNLYRLNSQINANIFVYSGERLLKNYQGCREKNESGQV
jgi:hypothetical protein